MKRIVALLICLMMAIFACSCEPEGGQDTSSSAASDITFNDSTANASDLPRVDAGDLEID